MTLTIHSLGSLDFLTNYLTDAEGDQGWSPQFDFMASAYALGDGARATRRKIGDTPRIFSVICLGADYNASRVNADALDTALIDAWNGQYSASPITYVEKDTSESVADTWKCSGGLYQRDNKLRPSSLVSGILTLHLSKA